MNKYFFFIITVLRCSELWAQPPSGTIASSSNSVCSGKTVQFTLTTTGNPTAIVWKVPNGTYISSSGSSLQIAVTFTMSGIKTVTAVLSNGTGSFQITSAINVVASAKASFLARPEHSAVPCVVNLTNYSSSFLQTNWYLNNNFSLPFAGSITAVSFTNPGTHSLTLVAMGQSGCNDTNTFVLRLFDKSSLKLPNIFTPNGDGVNDVFRPIMEGIKSVHVVIYNRWGVLMKEWTELNGFWDGYTSADLPCPDGTYFVLCEAEGVDGMRYALKGTLQLAR